MGESSGRFCKVSPNNKLRELETLLITYSRGIIDGNESHIVAIKISSILEIHFLFLFWKGRNPFSKG
jgi:hypothetical protein